MRPPLIGRSEHPHDQKQFAFRSEFRPLNILHYVYFTCLTSVQKKHCPLCLGVCGVGFCFLFGVGFLGFVLLFGFGVFGLLSPINMQCFLSFYDDLGTPPTWRPHSWEKMKGQDGDVLSAKAEFIAPRFTLSH